MYFSTLQQQKKKKIPKDASREAWTKRINYRKWLCYLADAADDSFGWPK